MNAAEYAPPVADPFTRWLWRAAGADERILAHCPYADHVKFACLGGIVLSTGVLAMLAASYAFYTIFGPTEAHPSAGAELTARGLALLLGGGWGLLIFNLDRYIVASTGKGDGSEAITLRELTNALPRMLLGLIIAITISKPLELRIFKPEIDAAIYHTEQLELTKNRRVIEQNHAPELTKAREAKARLETEIAAQRRRANDAQAAATAELDGTGGSGRASPGPIYQHKVAIAEQEARNLDALIAQDAPLLDAATKELARRESDLQTELGRSQTAVSGMTGFLERMKLAHELAGPQITWAITLLFVAIELTPIFFKLMLIRGPYDYFEENVKELLLARQGIERAHDFAETRDGTGAGNGSKAYDIHRVTFHRSQQLLAETRQAIEAEAKLTQKSLEQWEAAQLRQLSRGLGAENGQPAAELA